MTEVREVNVCAIPYEMSIVDGGVLFSCKSGFWGVSSRLMFAYICDLWYLVDFEDSDNKVPLCHLVRMHELLTEHIGGNHEVREVVFRQ